MARKIYRRTGWAFAICLLFFSKLVHGGSECAILDSIVTSLQIQPSADPFYTNVETVISLNQPNPIQQNFTVSGNNVTRVAFIYYSGSNPSPIGGDFEGDLLCSLSSRRIGETRIPPTLNRVVVKFPSPGIVRACLSLDNVRWCMQRLPIPITVLDNLQIAAPQIPPVGTNPADTTAVFPNILFAKTPINAFVVNNVIGGGTPIQGAFARAGECQTNRTNPGRFQAQSTRLLPNAENFRFNSVGDYRLCLLIDNVWHEQVNTVVAVTSPFQNLVKSIIPNQVVATAPQFFFAVPGLYGLPNGAVRIAFVQRGFGSCDDSDTRIPQLGIPVLTNSQRAGSQDSPLVFANPGSYALCVSMDSGVTWIRQQAPTTQLSVTDRAFSLVTAITPTAVRLGDQSTNPAGTNCTSSVFVVQGGVGNGRIMLALAPRGYCTAPAARVGDSLLSPGTTSFGPVWFRQSGVHAVCISLNQGITWIEQTTNLVTVESTLSRTCKQNQATPTATLQPLVNVNIGATCVIPQNLQSRARFAFALAGFCGIQFLRTNTVQYGGNLPGVQFPFDGRFVLCYSPDGGFTWHEQDQLIFRAMNVQTPNILLSITNAGSGTTSVLLGVSTRIQVVIFGDSLPSSFPVNQRIALAPSGSCGNSAARIAATQGTVANGGRNITFTVTINRAGVYALCYSPQGSAVWYEQAGLGANPAVIKVVDTRTFIISLINPSLLLTTQGSLAFSLNFVAQLGQNPWFGIARFGNCSTLNGTNVRDNVGQIIGTGNPAVTGSATISSLRLPAGIYAACYSPNARVAYFEQQPLTAPQPFITSRPPNTLVFEAIAPRVLDRTQAYTIGMLPGVDAGLFPQGNVVGQVGFSLAEENCTGTIYQQTAVSRPPYSINARANIFPSVGTYVLCFRANGAPTWTPQLRPLVSAFVIQGEGNFVTNVQPPAALSTVAQVQTVTGTMTTDGRVGFTRVPDCSQNPEVTMPPSLYVAPVTFPAAGLYFTCYQPRQGSWRFQTAQSTHVLVNDRAGGAVALTFEDSNLLAGIPGTFRATINQPFDPSQVFVAYPGGCNTPRLQIPTTYSTTSLLYSVTLPTMGQYVLCYRGGGNTNFEQIPTTLSSLMITARDATTVAVGIGWAMVASTRNTITVAGINIPSYDWFLDREDSGGRRCRPTVRLSSTGTTNTYSVAGSINQIYTLCMCVRGSTSNCYGQRSVPRIYYFSSGNPAAVIFAFSNTTVAVDEPVEVMSINYTAVGSVQFPMNVGFVRERDIDRCDSADRRVYQSTIQEAGCTTLRPTGSKIFPDLGVYFMCVQQRNGAWTRQLTTLSRVLAVGNLDPNQPFVSTDPSQVLINDELSFSVFGTPLSGAKLAFARGGSGNTCGGQKFCQTDIVTAAAETLTVPCNFTSIGTYVLCYQPPASTSWIRQTNPDTEVDVTQFTPKVIGEINPSTAIEGVEVAEFTLESVDNQVLPPDALLGFSLSKNCTNLVGELPIVTSSNRSTTGTAGPFTFTGTGEYMVCVRQTTSTDWDPQDLFVDVVRPTALISGIDPDSFSNVVGAKTMELSGPVTSLLVGGTFAMIAGTNCSTGRFGAQTVPSNLRVSVTFSAEGSYNVCFRPEGSNIFYRQAGVSVTIQDFSKAITDISPQYVRGDVFFNFTLTPSSVTGRVQFSTSSSCSPADVGPIAIASGRLINVQMPTITANTTYFVCYAPTGGATFTVQNVTVRATPGPTQDIKFITPNQFTVNTPTQTTFTGATGTRIAFVPTGSDCSDASRRVSEVPITPPGGTVTVQFPNTGTYTMCEFVSTPNGQAGWFRQQATASVRPGPSGTISTISPGTGVQNEPTGTFTIIGSMEPGGRVGFSLSPGCTNIINDQAYTTPSAGRATFPGFTPTQVGTYYVCYRPPGAASFTLQTSITPSTVQISLGQPNQAFTAIKPTQVPAKAPIPSFTLTGVPLPGGTVAFARAGNCRSSRFCQQTLPASTTGSYNIPGCTASSPFPGPGWYVLCFLQQDSTIWYEQTSAGMTIMAV